MGQYKNITTFIGASHLHNYVVIISLKFNTSLLQSGYVLAKVL